VTACKMISETCGAAYFHIVSFQYQEIFFI